MFPTTDLTIASLALAQVLHPEPMEALERDETQIHVGFYSDSQGYVFRHPVTNRRTTVPGVRSDSTGERTSLYYPIDVKTGKPYNYNPF